ncbi:MAG: hypothetical protein HPY76_03625 [Anaerolineae bacterium]|nr:hypothetical protein [Anaerolineae bacterium]
MDLKQTLGVPFILLLMAVMACNLPLWYNGTPTPDEAEQTLTSVALTVSAVPTSGNSPTPGGIATNTLAPTPVPPTPIPPTPVPPTAVPCDQATFIADITIPDGTQMAPNQNFTKTWRLRNSGSCTWSTSYQIIFASGDAMGAPAAFNMPGSVAPNQTIDISINMTAPGTPGTYQGNFLIRNTSGATYGVGTFGYTVPFFVNIKVIAPGVTPTRTSTSPSETLIYSFVTNYCLAEWIGGEPAVVLPCPGNDSDGDGYVLKLNNPTMETNNAAGSASLETRPKWVDDGVITGKFPAILIQNGYRFRAKIGCLKDADACNVNFQVNYREGGGTLQTLGTWNEIYDGALQSLDIDLSSLAGSSVEIVLAVAANGSTSEDWAVWIDPRIVQ